MQEQHEKLFVNLLDEYGYETVMFNSSKTRLGYSGTVTYAKRRCYISQRSINHEVGDMEGRMVLLQFPGVYVINVYTMNSGTELRRLDMRMSWDSAFRKMIRQVREDGKPIMVLGDLNVAHEDYDVYDAKQAQGAPGFSHLERQSFRDTLESCGLVDAYRMLYPEERERYTFWEYKTRARARNAGWRIDYALVSEDMVGAVSNVRILDDVEGSDHCPVAIDIAAGML